MRKKEIYGNCRVYHPDGSLMFLCVEKKINWYLNRGLAEIIDSDPLSIKLNFEPKGKGAWDSKYNEEDRKYLLGTKSNSCVVCGSDDLSTLSKHHVVPHEYRKFFPTAIKGRSSHDIVPICRRDHDVYENTFANKLKRKLESDLGIDPKDSVYKKLGRMAKAHSFARMLMNPDRVMKLPDDRIAHFTEEIRQVFGSTPIPEVASMNMKKISKERMEEVAKLVVENLNEEEIMDFIQMWRSDFIESMRPRFLPAGWSIDHKIEKC